jgi:hypothetical protein
VSERLGRITLGVVSGLILIAAALVDLPHASDGRFWSDGATYYAMAGSLAFDGDVAFGPEDLARVRASYPGGPQGVFLKRVGDRRGGKRLVYAKPLLYPAAAAPWVRLLGADRGLPVLNALVFVAALWLGYALLRGEAGGRWAAFGTLTVFCCGVTPVYLPWQQPEVFNLGLVVLGLFLWRRERPLAAALALGAAAYAKPTNLALALPLLLDPLLAGFPAGSRPAAASGLGGPPASWRRRGFEAARRALVVALVFAGGFAVNRAATGELNYQGGERKTFYDRYPFDPGVSFDSAGVWMTTDHVGPLVAGRDEDEQTSRVAPPRAPWELRQSFALNLVWFWIGRFGGVLPYFPGFALAALFFLVSGPRRRAGWLALVALVVSWLGYLLIIPDNWYGGAGALGNRYFVNVVPIGLLLLPGGRARWGMVLAWPAAALWLLPMLVAPVDHALRPGAHATRAAFRMLPAELTMLGDLSVFTDVWRKRRPYNGAELELARRAPSAPLPYFLWFLDDGTFGQEASFHHDGFWLRGGAEAEVVVQAPERPTSIRLGVTAGPAGDIVTIRLGGERQRLVLPPLRRQAVVLSARGAVGYYGTCLYRLRLGSRYGAATDRDPRRLGSFVEVALDDGSAAVRRPAASPPPRAGD